jgi:hypothetical protein
VSTREKRREEARVAESEIGSEAADRFLPLSFPPSEVTIEWEKIVREGRREIGRRIEGRSLPQRQVDNHREDERTSGDIDLAGTAKRKQYLLWDRADMHADRMDHAVTCGYGGKNAYGIEQLMQQLENLYYRRAQEQLLSDV